MYDRIVTTRRSNLFVVETILALLVLFAIDLFFFPSKPAFQNVNPNPLWLLILLIPARYGRNAGLFCSTIVSAYFFVAYMAQFGLDIFFEEPLLFRYPFLFFLIGFLLGEIKSIFILREDYLTKRMEEVQNLNEKLNHENDIIKEAHRDLSKDIATRQDSLSMLYKMTNEFSSTDESHIYQGLLDCLVEYLKIEECSFYALEGPELHLKVSHGWKDYYRRLDTIQMGKGMVGLVAQRRDVLSIKDFVLGKAVTQDDDLGVLGDCVLAIPVITSQEDFYGVVSVEKIPLLKLTEATIHNARIVCELAADSLKTAQTLKAMQATQIHDKDLGLYKYHYFEKRLEEEFLRSLNYMLPLSVIIFKWENLGKRDPARKNALLKSITALIHSSLHPFDVLATGPTAEVPMVLLLATTARNKAEDLKIKIIQKIAEYELNELLTDGKVSDSIVVQDYNPHLMNNAKDLLKQAGLSV
jgi:hypothetical protein